MITKRRLMGLMAGATALAIGAGAAQAQDVTLKMHQFLPGQAPVPQKILLPWAKRVEDASGGKIKIDHYPAMQLGGKPPELVGQVQDGIADIVWTVTGYTPGRFPQSEAFELPFTMTTGEATSRAYYQYAAKNMFDKDFKDLKILAVWVHGAGVIHSKAPIKDVKDLNGVKLRAPTRVTNKLFTALGATPVGMPVPAVPESLSKGVIDATVIPWEVTGALKVHELVESHTEFAEPLYTSTFIFAMNKDKYESLPQELKDAIDSQSGEEFAAMAGRIMDEIDVPGREAAVAHGNNVITLTDEETQAWKDASAGVKDEWVKEMDDLGLDGQGLIDEAASLIESNTK